MSASSPFEAVGNYAVRLTFDDLHDTGIYSWDYLYRLGQEQDGGYGTATSQPSKAAA